jgi:hypothetical protein
MPRGDRFPHLSNADTRYFITREFMHIQAYDVGPYHAKNALPLSMWAITDEIGFLLSHYCLTSERRRDYHAHTKMITLFSKHISISTYPNDFLVAFRISGRSSTLQIELFCPPWRLHGRWRMDLFKHCSSVSGSKARGGQNPSEHFSFLNEGYAVPMIAKY